MADLLKVVVMVGHFLLIGGYLILLVVHVGELERLFNHNPPAASVSQESKKPPLS